MSEKNWFFWARKMMLLLGSALLLAGIIFFFAYNWDSMRPFQKLSLLEFGVVVCAVSAYFYGLPKLIGKILILFAAVLTGVLLAVYGQIYQTGADTYELFSLWAILIFGWVIIAKFDVLWLVWLIILNIAFCFYWSQIVRPVYHFHYDSLNIALACLNGAALIFYTAAVHRGVKWLKSKWLGKTLLLTVLVILSIPTINLISRTFYLSIPTQIATFMWSITIISGYIIYRYMFRDMLAVAMIITNACVILLTIIWKWLDVDMIALDGNSYNKYLMFSVIILIVAGITIYLLRKTAAIISKEKNTADCSFEEKNTLTKEPVYLRFISGTAAWFAAGFIIAAFGLFLLENEKIAILYGFIYFVAAIAISKVTKIRFFNQFALALAFAGNGLIIFGFASYRNAELPSLALSQTAVCLVFYPFFKNKIYRFAAPLTAALFTTFWILDDNISFAIHPLIAVEALLVGFLFLRKKIPDSLVPLAYSAAIMLPATILFSSINLFGNNGPIFLSGYYLAGGLIYLYFFLSRNERTFLKPWMILAIVTTALLGIFTSPGILAAIGLLIIGYEKNNKFLLILSNLFLICFLWIFYYDLNIDLAYKSWILAGSGLLLLIARWITGYLQPKEEKI